MTTDASPDPTGATAPARVETDLPCAKCGYNLRTLPWESKCPECATLVARSASPVGFRFETLKSERLLEIGIGVFAVALLVEALCYVLGFLAMWFIFSLPPSLCRFGLECWGWGVEYASGVLIFVSILLITQSFGNRARRFKPRLATAVLVLALLGAAERLVVPFLSETYMFDWYSPMTVRIAVSASHWCLFAALSLALVHLLLRIDRAQQVIAWWAIIVGLSASIVMLLAETLSACAEFALPMSLTVAPWRDILLRHSQWWQDNGIPASEIIVLLGLCAVRNRLRNAPRAT